MKLNKTETKLLEQAKKRNGIFTISHGLDGVYKTRPFGVREFNAAQSLVKKGLARFKNRHSCSVYTGTPGYFVPVTDATYEVIEQ